MKITKKSIIASSIIMAFTATANNYFVLIQKEDKYQVVENSLWNAVPSVYSEWIDTSVIENCETWLPIILNQETDFNQNSVCDVQQERTKTDQEQHQIDNTLRIVNQEIENQIVEKAVNRDIDVTSNTPLEIKSNYDCDVWTPDQSTIYLGTSFEQERYCNIDFKQEWDYYSDLELIETREELYTEKSGYETQIVTGLKSWESTASTFTDWTYTGVVSDCVEWLPAILEQKVDFTQSSTCNFEQTRTRTENETNPDTGETSVSGTYIETRNLSEPHNRNIVVTNDPIVDTSGIYNCGNLEPYPETVFYGTDYERVRECDIDKMQNWVYSLNGSEIANWEEHYTEDIVGQTMDDTGTMLLENCKEILEGGYSTGSGLYYIDPLNNGSPNQVYCDMTTEGGGWTAVWKNYGGIGATGINTPSLWARESSEMVTPNKVDGGILSSSKNKTIFDYYIEEKDVDILKTVRAYDNTTGDLIAFTARDYPTNPDIVLDLGANVSFKEIMNQGDNGVLNNQVSMTMNGIDYGKTDRILLFSTTGLGFANFQSEADWEGQTEDNLMKNWSARHMIYYTISDGQNAVRCQFQCWDGTEDFQIETVWYYR